MRLIEGIGVYRHHNTPAFRRGPLQDWRFTVTQSRYVLSLPVAQTTHYQSQQHQFQTKTLKSQKKVCFFIAELCGGLSVFETNQAYGNKGFSLPPILVKYRLWSGLCWPRTHLVGW